VDLVFAVFSKQIYLIDNKFMKIEMSKIAKDRYKILGSIHDIALFFGGLIYIGSKLKDKRTIKKLEGQNKAHRKGRNRKRYNISSFIIYRGDKKCTLIHKIFKGKTFK